MSTLLTCLLAVFLSVFGEKSLSTDVMGTGSSRNQVTIETLPADSSVDNDSSDVVVTRARRPPPIRQQTIEKIVTETGAEVGKLREKDPEDLLDVTSIHNEDELEDIQDLEQTFDSLGIPATSNLKSEQINDNPSNGRDLAPLRAKWKDVKIGVTSPEDSPKRDVGFDGTIGWAGMRSSSGPQTRLDIPPSKFVNNNYNNTKSAPMKFTWSLPEHTKSPDEWIYQKSTVDGFDPDKFRKVNNKKDPSEEQDRSSTTRNEDVVTLHPHSVPDYDVSEQQILDSIEKEYVS